MYIILLTYSSNLSVVHYLKFLYVLILWKIGFFLNKLLRSWKSIRILQDLPCTKLVTLCSGFCIWLGKEPNKCPSERPKTLSRGLLCSRFLTNKLSPVYSKILGTKLDQWNGFLWNQMVELTLLTLDQGSRQADLMKPDRIAPRSKLHLLVQVLARWGANLEHTCMPCSSRIHRASYENSCVLWCWST